jgi:hypothetical protein
VGTCLPNPTRRAFGNPSGIGDEKIDKKRATDWELVKTASTCFGCSRSACDDEIKQAIDQAHDHESFNELIATCIEHGLDCVYEGIEAF